MNKVSLLGIRVDACKCVSCGTCSKVCQMDADVVLRTQSCRMYPVRKVHRGLSCRCHQLSLWVRIKWKKSPLTADKK